MVRFTTLWCGQTPHRRPAPLWPLQPGRKGEYRPPLMAFGGIARRGVPTMACIAGVVALAACASGGTPDRARAAACQTRLRLSASKPARGAAGDATAPFKLFRRAARRSAHVPLGNEYARKNTLARHSLGQELGG